MAELADVLGRTFQTADLWDRQPHPPAWYALHTRSRFEKVVDRLLAGRGWETFLPLRTVRSRVSLRRSREAEIPLFPGYTFVRLPYSPEAYYRVRATTGVAGIVGNSSAPVSIPDIEIESLRRVLNHNLDCSLSPCFVPGQRVLVTAGPLQGIQGEIVRRKNQQLFAVKVHLIRRMLEINFRALDLELLIQ